MQKEDTFCLMLKELLPHHLVTLESLWEPMRRGENW